MPHFNSFSVSLDAILMSRKKGQRFECELVKEVVQISLTTRRGRGFGGESHHFVQCDQADCQYVDENAPPCPLRIEMFAAEIEEEEAEKKRRREEADQGWPPR